MDGGPVQRLVDARTGYLRDFQADQLPHTLSPSLTAQMSQCVHRNVVAPQPRSQKTGARSTRRHVNNADIFF